MYADILIRTARVQSAPREDTFSDQHANSLVGTDTPQYILYRQIYSFAVNVLFLFVSKMI